MDKELVSESMIRRLERFREGLKILKEISEISLDEYLSDLKLQSIAERNLQICIETIIDISNTIIARKSFRIPKSYKDTIKVLEENGVIRKEMSDELIRLVGLRNIIVHMYADIKSEIIYENLLDIISTLKRAMGVLLDYCEKHGIDP
mgnify:CR=1 FL=1